MSIHVSRVPGMNTPRAVAVLTGKLERLLGMLRPER